MLIDTDTGSPTDYPSVLAALREENVLTVKRLADGRYRVRERCDRYYAVYLTRDQLVAWADELRAMAAESRVDTGA